MSNTSSLEKDEKLRDLENQIIQLKGELALREAKIEELEIALKAVRDSATFRLKKKFVLAACLYFPPGTRRRSLLLHVRKKLDAHFD